MSELYDLPNGWEWKELNLFGKFIRGVSYKKEQLLETSTKDSFTLLRANNIQNELILDEIQIVPKDVAKGKEIKDGDILFAMSSGSKHLVGKNILLNGLENYTFGAFCSVYRNQKKDILDNYYLSYVLKSNLYRDKLSDLSMGANINNLKSSDLEIMKIPLPSLLEQQRIVSKLDNLFKKIDKSIALHQKNMDEADVFMRSVLNNVFGELEEKYSKQSILNGIYIGCQRGFNPTVVNGKVPFIGMSDIDEHNGINTKYVMEDYKNVSNGKTKFEKNAVLVGKITPCTQNNKTTIVPSDIDGGFATTEVYALHSMDNMNPYYLNHFMRSKEVNEFLVSTMVGATGRQRVPSESIKNLNISIPSLITQRKVVDYLDDISEKIERIKSIQKEKMDSLKALKASILDKAFRGEL